MEKGNRLYKSSVLNLPIDGQKNDTEKQTRERGLNTKWECFMEDWKGHQTLIWIAKWVLLRAEFIEASIWAAATADQRKKIWLLLENLFALKSCLCWNKFLWSGVIGGHCEAYGLGHEAWASTKNGFCSAKQSVARLKRMKRTWTVWPDLAKFCYFG